MRPIAASEVPPPTIPGGPTRLGNVFSPSTDATGAAATPAGPSLNQPIGQNSTTAAPK